MTCRSRWPSRASSPARRSTTPRTTCSYQQQRLAILQAQHRPGRGAAVEPARPAARLRGLAQQQPGDRPRQPRASSTSARRSPASSAASRSSSASRCSGRADRPDRQRRPQQAASPMSTNSISAGSQSGQTATVDVDGKTYRLKVAKIYPQVRNGQFQIDLLFVGAGAAVDPARPDHAGQADARRFRRRALLIPNGAFFNDTGGNWVFVVDTRRQQRDQAPGPARPPQRRFHRSARRARSPASASSPPPTAGWSTRTGSPSSTDE